MVLLHSLHSSGVEGLTEKPASTGTGATLCPPDYSTPLTIQTSPAPSSSSTDTSSEVGSAFNSPTQGLLKNSFFEKKNMRCVKKV